MYPRLTKAYCRIELSTVPKWRPFVRRNAIKSLKLNLIVKHSSKTTYQIKTLIGDSKKFIRFWTKHFVMEALSVTTWARKGNVIEEGILNKLFFNIIKNLKKLFCVPYILSHNCMYVTILNITTIRSKNGYLVGTSYYCFY